MEVNNIKSIINDSPPLINAINESIKTKMFIPRGIKNTISNISENSIFLTITDLINSNVVSYKCITISNIIEWTPVKLFQTAYFIVKLHDKFWLVSRDGYSCHVLLTITMKDYIDYIYKKSNSDNSTFLENIYWPQLIEFSNVLHNLRTNDYTFVKKSIYNKSSVFSIILHHYLYKLEDCIWYIAISYSVSSLKSYKPILLYKIT